MRLQLTRRAENDLKRVYDFNMERSESWAIKVQGRLKARMNGLMTASALGRRSGKKGVFQLSIPDIQYVIDYRRGADFIRILRVRHTREIQ